MPGPNPNEITSLNFAFLAKHDGVLARHAALAERYVFDDPNSALLKLRQFSELLTRHTAAYVGIAPRERESQQQLIDRLYEGRIINPQVSQLLHGIRKSGNLAAHEHTGDKREALHQLQMARKLAIWFHKSFGHDPSFQPDSFVPPPNPADSERELQSELERLRETLLATQEQATEAQQLAEARAERLIELEAAARTAYDDQTAALELAAESEERLQQEREAFQLRLVEVQTQVAASPADELEEVIQVAQHEAEALDLDEAATRHIIDAQLRDAGWEVDTPTLRYAAGTRPIKGRNIAIAEWPTDNGPADYVLFVGLTPIAVVEAKRKRKDVANAIEQSKRYSKGFNVESSHVSAGGPWDVYKVPFLFATNGRPYLRQIAEKSGIWFHDAREETNHPRALEAWYTPEGLEGLLDQDIEAADARLEAEPTDYLPLRDYQAEAVRSVERGIADGKRELLVAMATGTGKTITCIGLIYRLIKTKRFRRILFLVDRTSLGEQAADKLKDVRLENLQTFPDIYDVKELGDLKPEADTRLHISTVQGMVKRILYPGNEAEPVPVDWYDCSIIDECHRGYNLDQEMSDAELQFRNEAEYVSKYRRVLDHFDAVRIGMTATPALHTTEIFGPPIINYSYRQAVVDGWLTDHEPPYRFVTELGDKGMKWDRGDEMQVYHTKTGQLELFNTPDEVNIEIEDFNRKVITENFNRTVCQALAEHIDPNLPGKTLIFCATDSHADMVVRLLKAAFDDVYGPVHDDTVKKITGASDKPSLLIRRYKNEQLPKVAVTVDLLTTGVDVPEITNIVFLRRVRSRILFDQMLGRGTRLCPNLHGPGEDKKPFHVYDAVNTYDALQALTDMKPVVTRPNITFKQLANELCDIKDESFRSDVRQQLLAKLRRKKLNDDNAGRLEIACGIDHATLIKKVQQTDPDELGKWLADHPTVIDVLDAVYAQGSRLIISVHEDSLLGVERGYGKASKPEDYLDAFRKYITDNQDQLPALVVVTQRPRDLTRSQLRELRLQLDTAGFSEARLRTAVRETTNLDIAASIVGYIRHVALGQPLISHRDRVAAAMKKIMASRSWTEPQRKWLERIGKQLEQEVIVDRDALDGGQFKAQGGFQRLNKVFQGKLDDILREIAETMWQVAV